VSRVLSVWWDGRIAGALRVSQQGEMRFAYEAAWLADAARPPISCSLPKRPEPFRQRECRPFFAGLLPEETQREAAADALGLSKGNDFKLLEALGGEVAGALTLWPEGETPPVDNPAVAVSPLDDAALGELLDSLPARPLLAGREGFRLSLAGAQSKLPVVLVDNNVALPAPGQPTTHIVKPPIARLAATTENEALVMRLAATLKLDVAPVDVRVVAGRPCLLVTRYDRRVDGAGRARRLHQEDFCQALGVLPEHKYSIEGGPAFKTSFDLLRRVATRPAIATLALLDAAIFNVLVGNADAHGKNFSLLYDDGDVRLAPLYDLLCTAAYPDLSAKLAMRIATKATLDDIRTTTWPAFAADIGMSAPFIRKRVKELAFAAPDAASTALHSLANAGLDPVAMARYVALLASRAERLAATT